MNNRDKKSSENNKTANGKIGQKNFVQATSFFDVARIKQKLNQAVSLLVILCLLAISTPAAPKMIFESAAVFQQNVIILFKINEWFSNLFTDVPDTPVQETQAERNARVTRIEIASGEGRFLVGKKISLVAVAYSQNDNPVAGVTFDWEILDSSGNRKEIINNIFAAENVGEYTISVRGAGQVVTSKFTVTNANEEFVSESDTQQLLPYGEWDVTNISHATRIKNIRGNPPGKPKGKNNFNIIAPVVSMPGRGQNMDLNLYYNSLVWSLLDQDISYDMDKDWLSPGWNIGYGKIINLINGGIVQVDSDGTRRFYAGSIEGGNDLVTFKGQSTDGSFVKAMNQTSVSPNGQCFYNPTTFLKYPNGTTIYYDVFEYRGCYGLSEPITMVPKAIQDKNGNQITITYCSPSDNCLGPNAPGRWINKITDTLGRVYTFNYTLENGRYYLTSITGQGLPDENNTEVTRTFVRLQYKNFTISHNFSGLTPHVRESNIKVLSAIYYPATQSGYWFGDVFGEPDAYSPYGMLRKVNEQRAMSYSASTGISQGTTTRQRTYSYPSDTSTPISDIPTFSTVTESWEGMTTAAPTTQYQVNWDSNPRTTETISADSSRVIEYSYNLSTLNNEDPEKLKDGLSYKTEFYDSAGLLRSRSEIEWELGYQVNNVCPIPANGCVNAKIPRPKKITQSEYENGNTFTKITNNNYGETGEYNQVLETTEIGYGGQNDVLRRTVNEYTKKGDSPTTGDEWAMMPRLINLPTTVEVFDAANTRIGYAKYEYDLNALKPFSGANPPGFCTSAYCNLTTQRGNLSKTTSYENVANLTGAFINDSVYDKSGNLVEHTPEITGTTVVKNKFIEQTAYAFAAETSTGSNNVLFPNVEVKSTATYNYNTGLQLTVTDPNLQTVQLNYDVQTWRLARTNLPTGGYSTINYDDINRAYTEGAYLSGNALVGKQIQKINGLGLVSRQESFTKTENGQDIYDVVEVEYDQFGRAKRTSNPFRSNESSSGVYWTEVFYDGISRIWKTVSPNGSTKFDYFNESARPQGASSLPGMTYRMKDPIGREKWYRTDSDGNIAEVIEPDPNGNGSVATNGLLTKYTFDKLKRLTQTEQGSQIRKFRYDSLGRLINQKMAETSATLDDNGNFVGEPGGTWSDFYVYDKLSNVVSYKDARGVTTNYSYQNSSLPGNPLDPLNRLSSISYNTNGATDVLPSPTVDFEYQPTGNIAQLKSVTAQGVSKTELGYDTRGRINEKKTTILNRPSYPMTTNYVYDSLSRITDTIYPTQYGASGLRKTVHYDFDTAGRMSSLKVDNVNYASDLVFNNFNQVTSLKIGQSGANQITETYSYNPQTGLMENQKVLRGSTALFDLSYEYQLCSCSTGGTGQITKIKNNLDRNKDKTYEYDALARLKKVTGGINQSWSQTYSYDRYGNKTGVTAFGVEALVDENSQANGENKQNKIINESIPLSSVPKANKLLSEIQNLTKIDGDNTEKSDKEKSNEAETAKNDNQASSMPPNKTPFDFDYDGKADFAVFQKGNGDWVVNQSGNNQAITAHFGASGDQIAPGDYDNDGKADFAVWRPSTGVWYILQSSNGQVTIFSWGSSGDSIMPADYDGDGKTDMAVWRPSTGVWYILRSSDGGYSATAFGNQQFGDIPVAADYDGDNKADIAVWRPSTGEWYILQSSNGQAINPVFGLSGDVPVAAKYDNDNKNDLAIWRPSTGVWYVLQSTNGQVTTTGFGGQQFGDIPVSADYDGDTKADIAVWRQPTGTWYVLRSSDGGVTTFQFGVSGNIAVPSAYRRRSSAPQNQNKEIPRDGLASVTYNESTNRITNSGFIYDSAGNQTRAIKEDGTALRYQYDAANRLVKVKNDNLQTLVTYTYGESRERLITQEGDENSTNRTYYAWEGGAVISEFVDSVSNALTWTKNYVYMGGRLLATHEQIANVERLQFNHSDRLGTRVITNPTDGTSFEQATLPYGKALDSESSGAINRRFTSYDRSASTGLDYAINRFYDSSQGRFTQVDPIKMNASTLMNPQTLNLYAYTANDPINRTDPDGKFWGFITGVFKFLFGGGTQFNFNFNINGFPISFGFQGHFRNIYVGIAGFTVQVTGKDSIFNLFRKNQQTDNQTLFDEAVSAVNGILRNPNSSCRSFFGAFAHSAFQKLISKGVTFNGLSNSTTGIAMRIVIPQYAPISQLGVGLSYPLFNNEYLYLNFAPNAFVVNTNGPFIRNGGPVPSMGNYSAGSLKIRVLQLLHELGHVTVIGFNNKGVNKDLKKLGYLSGTLLLPVDGDDPSLSVENTNKVLTHCKKEIDALGD